MKKTLSLIFALSCLIAANAHAGKDLKNISIQDALKSEDAKSNLNTDIKFYFGDEKPEGTVTKEFAEYTFDREINGTLKSQILGCQAALVSALKELSDAAKKEGGNAVINIRSNADGKSQSNRETFACSSNFFISKVSITGNVVKVE